MGFNIVKSFTKEGGGTDMFERDERDIDSDMFKPLIGALLIDKEAHEKNLVVKELKPGKNGVVIIKDTAQKP